MIADAAEPAIGNARRLLGRIVELENESDEDQRRERDGAISGDEHHQKVHEYGEAMERR